MEGSPRRATFISATKQEQNDFIDRVATGAQASEAKWGVPASVTIAQAALESGWGKSQLATICNNYFGVKAREGEAYREFPTTEFEPLNVTYATNPGDTAEEIAFRFIADVHDVMKAAGAKASNEPLAAGKTLKFKGLARHREFAKFAKYQDTAGTFERHGELLATLNRYRPAMAKAGDPLAFAIELQHCGYSTNPRYPSLLASLINQFNLSRFDAKTQAPQADAAATA
jgi:flagellum-specific peptidoglycan hydrolase FlgJ